LPPDTTISHACTLVTGRIAHSASRWYLIYSEADFEVFRPEGARRCTDGGEIWRGRGDLCHLTPLVPSSTPNFTPISATTRV